MIVLYNILTIVRCTELVLGMVIPRNTTTREGKPFVDQKTEYY